MRIRIEVILCSLMTALASGAADGQMRYSFDTAEDFFAPADFWPAWQDTLNRHQSDRDTLLQCLDDEDACTRRLRGLRHILLKGADLSREQQLRLVNRYINRQRYVEDRVSSASDAGNHWETLIEFLHKGGDCEDFAVAKYFVLREFGVAADDMRIVIGREARRAAHHAMLAIRLGDNVWLLENDNSIRGNGKQDINKFVYAINEQGIWDHEK